MNRLECLSSEIASDSHDFPARRSIFPVHDHRESIATAAKMVENLSSGSVRNVKFGRISLYFPCRSGIRLQRRVRSRLPPTAIESAWAETPPRHLAMAREIRAIPRGIGSRAALSPNRRRRVRGSKDPAAHVFLCCQLGRFGIELLAPSDRTREESCSARRGGRRRAEGGQCPVLPADLSLKSSRRANGHAETGRH